MSPNTYTIEQLAVLFQRSASTTRSYLAELEGQHGFPPRLPCFENLWSKPAVDRWIEGNGQDPAKLATIPVDIAGTGPLADRYGAAQ